jgi:hypothetical protein
LELAVGLVFEESPEILQAVQLRNWGTFAKKLLLGFSNYLDDLP